MFVHKFLIIASHSVLNGSAVAIKQSKSALKIVKNIAGKLQKLVVCIFISSYQSVTVRSSHVEMLQPLMENQSEPFYYASNGCAN